MADPLTPVFTAALRPLLTGPDPLHAWIEPASSALASELGTACPRLEWTRSATTRVAVAVLDARTSTLDKQALAYWRDVGAEHLFVAVCRHEHFERDLIALGLRVLARAEEHEVWVFDIAHYKPTPDWLNPRYWAHPERWEQTRW